MPQSYLGSKWTRKMKFLRQSSSDTETVSSFPGLRATTGHKGHRLRQSAMESLCNAPVWCCLEPDDTEHNFYYTRSIVVTMVYCLQGLLVTHSALTAGR